MYKYVVIDEQAGVVRATLETPDQLVNPSSEYHEYSSLNTKVPFDEIIECLYSPDNGFTRPPEPTPEELAIEWRNSELDYIDGKNFAPDFPYLDLVNAYKQELRDYPEKDGFPNCPKPERPLTPKGKPILT